MDALVRLFAALLLDVWLIGAWVFVIIPFLFMVSLFIFGLLYGLGVTLLDGSS